MTLDSRLDLFIKFPQHKTSLALRRIVVRKPSKEGKFYVTHACTLKGTHAAEVHAFSRAWLIFSPKKKKGIYYSNLSALVLPFSPPFLALLLFFAAHSLPPFRISLLYAPIFSTLIGRSFLHFHCSLSLLFFLSRLLFISLLSVLRPFSIVASAISIFLYKLGFRFSSTS